MKTAWCLFFFQAEDGIRYYKRTGVQTCALPIYAAIRAHNTLSAETTHVQVFYPFHPLHGGILQIVRRPKRGDGAVSIIDPTGRRLKSPVWMLLPECARLAQLF